ncbi:TPA: hypothetical protein N0F65_012693 [Lagenidium giganteum]|uniref:Palmitoyltransferase n=1 Tax=Lagenidium giganteum TaxID=4803 RepID=A0AAV2YEK4_9STRA|nr:TPA: hypothetical protein N0F65_012693 [Lagenidium giganteum]
MHRASVEAMELEYDGQNAFTAAANGDFPLVVLIWGMAMAPPPPAAGKSAGPVDLLAATDAAHNSLLHHTAASPVDPADIAHFLLQQIFGSQRQESLVDARNVAQETPLIRAAHVGNLRVTDILINFGRASLGARDSNGHTPAHHAAAEGHLWVLHYLLESEAKLIQPPHQNRSEPLGGLCPAQRDVLYYAARSGHAVIVDYLLRRGFSADRADADGRTLLEQLPKGSAAYDTVRKLVKAHMTAMVSGGLNEEGTPSPLQRCGFHYIHPFARFDSFPTCAQQSTTTIRSTRVGFLLLYGVSLFAFLSTCYYLPWCIALPLLVVTLVGMFMSMRPSHGHGHGHGHGGPEQQKPANAAGLLQIHASKRKVKVPPTAPLTTPALPKASGGILGSLLKAQPEGFIGVWLGWVLLFTFFYIVLWVDPKYKHISRDNSVLMGVVGAVEVVFLLSWLRLAVVCPSDPGVIKTFETDIEEFLKNSVFALPLNTTTDCHTCLVRKPIRSKHCSRCGVCVARMDHHCVWINRCVGFDNHRLFVVFLVLHCIIIAGFVALSILTLVDVIVHDGKKPASAMDVWIKIPGLVDNHLLVLVVLGWGFPAFFALTIMLKQQLENAAKNMTVNEAINWRRYAYLNGSGEPNSPSKMKNVFDRGPCANLSEFWRRSGPYARDYHDVFEAPGSLAEAEAADGQPLHGSIQQA